MLNPLELAQVDTLSDLTTTQKYLIIYVRSEGGFYYYNFNTETWTAISSFAPDSISDLVFWYEVRNSGFPYADLDPVTAMTDLGPNGHDITGMDDLVYHENSGNPYMQIDSVAAYNGSFTIPSILDLVQAVTNSFSSFWITKYNSTLGVWVNGLVNVGPNENMFRLLNPYTDGRCYIACGSVLTSGGQPSCPDFTEQYNGLFHVWEFHRNGNLVELYCDGVAKGTFNNNFDAPTLVDAGPESVVIFGSGSAGFTGGNASHKAGLHYARYLTVDERTAVRSYLMSFV
jgi:hypothetical protein